LIKRLRKVVGSLPGQAVFAAIINVVIFCCSIIRVYFFSKGLSVEEFGVMSIMLTASAFGTYFFTLGSFQYVFKNASSKENKYLAFKTSLLFSCCISIITYIIFFFFNDYILSMIGLKGYGNIVQQNLLSSFLMSVLMLISFIRLGELKNNEYNLIQLLRQVPWIMICFLVYTFFGKIELQTVFIIINISIFLSILISIKKRDITELLKTKSFDVRGLFHYSLPLLPYYLGLWGIPMIVRMFIGIYLGYDNLAIFSVSYTMIDMVFLFISSIISTLTPYFFNANLEGDAKVLYNRMIKLSFIGTLFCLFGVLLLREELVLLITSPKYILAADYLIYLFPLALIKIISLTFEQFYLKESLTKKLGIVYTISILLTFVSAKYAIQYFNVWGAIITAFVPQLVNLILLYSGQKEFLNNRLIKANNLIFLCIFLCVIIALIFLFKIPLAGRIVILCIALSLSIFRFNLWDDRETSLLKNVSIYKKSSRNRL
jgi:O-antigen/teichoic acid export membrane protein